MTTARFNYAVFGLRVASEIALPELCGARDFPGRADLEIRIGPAPEILAGGVRVDASVAALPGRLLLDVEPGRYLVEDGRRITVEPRPGASERDLRGYLLGSAFGAAWHQKGRLPLHANVVALGEDAIAFVGDSGAGKSTLAAQFHRMGRRVLNDDVSLVTFDARGAPLAWPGLRRIKLWDDALRALGFEPASLERVFEGEEKYSLPLPEGRDGEPLRLRRIYVLGRADDGEVRLDRLRGRAALEAVLTNIYRWEFAGPLGCAAGQFAQAVRLAAACEVFTLSRPWRPASLARDSEAVASRLLEGGDEFG